MNITYYAIFHFHILITEPKLGPIETSTMESFSILVRIFQPLTIVTKPLHLRCLRKPWLQLLVNVGLKTFYTHLQWLKNVKGPIFLLIVKPKKNGLIREGFFK